MCSLVRSTPSCDVGSVTASILQKQHFKISFRHVILPAQILIWILCDQVGEAPEKAFVLKGGEQKSTITWILCKENALQNSK